jgi:hypothetical protein
MKLREAVEDYAAEPEFQDNVRRTYAELTGSTSPSSKPDGYERLVRSASCKVSTATTER